MSIESFTPQAENTEVESTEKNIDAWKQSVNTLIEFFLDKRRYKDDEVTNSIIQVIQQFTVGSFTVVNQRYPLIEDPEGYTKRLIEVRAKKLEEYPEKKKEIYELFGQAGLFE